MSATDCEWRGGCDSVARFSGSDAFGGTKSYCGVHADREKMNWNYFNIQGVNGSIKDKPKPKATVSPPVGMF